MRFSFFGSSLVSAYWNEAATYYRGLLRALAARGHQVTFYEPDAFGRQQHRDIDDPPWARVVVYAPTTPAAFRELDRAAAASDVLVKFSGVGVLDRELEQGVAALSGPGLSTIFWDVDAPATLDSLGHDRSHPLNRLVPAYDAVFTYGGGPAVVAAYAALGAQLCLPIYNAVDTATHHPVPPRRDFASDLSFLGNRLPDREARVDAFFLDAARRLPESRFLIGGSGWETKPLPANVRNVGHVFTADHNAFNCSARAVLNINRESMARYGSSPPTRIFEAAGAGACVLSDRWPGIEDFFTPGREILLVEDGADIAETLAGLSVEHAAAIGARALRRVAASHTYAQRAAQVEAALQGRDGWREAV